MRSKADELAASVFACLGGGGANSCSLNQDTQHWHAGTATARERLRGQPMSPPLAYARGSDTDQLLGENLYFLGRHIAGNRAVVNRYTIAAHIVMQYGSVRQVAQIRNIDALRPPTVVDAHHSLIAVL